MLVAVYKLLGDYWKDTRGNITRCIIRIIVEQKDQYLGMEFGITLPSTMQFTYTYFVEMAERIRPKSSSSPYANLRNLLIRLQKGELALAIRFFMRLQPAPASCLQVISHALQGECKT